MPNDSSPEPQRILLLTGLLGAGKTTALNALEDLGWETLDNFPIRFLNRMIGEGISKSAASPPAPLAIGFDIRTRGFVPDQVIAKVKDIAQRRDIELTTVFLDCSDEELARRYNETRRRHPLAIDMPAAAGISAERELLAPLRRWADVLIDTSAFTAKELQEAIRAQFAQDAPQELTVTVSSFGFARGMPPAADYVFDMRFLDNPHWQDELRELTGLDQAVGDHIRADSAFAPNFHAIRKLVLGVLPKFREQRKAYVHIAFGCTGGRHRSVYCAEAMADALREAGFSPTIIHRNLQSRAADLVESQGGQ